MKTKIDLRKSWKQKLSSLSLNDQETLSREIAKNLAQLFRKLDVHSKKLIVGAYAPFQQEPIWFLDCDENLHETTAYPGIVEGEMVFRLARMGDLKNKKDFGPEIKGPDENRPVVNPDLVLIPGLAFDETGRRLGRGKGYYDKALEHKADVVKVGVAFDLQIADELPSEAHDVLMDFIVTEKRIINCNSKKFSSHKK